MAKRPESDAAEPRRELSRRDHKRLWGKAAGRCSYTDCRCRLIREFPETGETAVVGQHAHQKPHRKRGPRGVQESGLPREFKERPLDPTGPANYENTILLCGSCHITIDQAPEFHTLEKLAKMKSDHEAWVQRRLDRKKDRTSPENVDVEIVVKVAKREVGFFSAMIRSRSEISRLWDYPMFGGRGERPKPRVSGVKPGPPQTVFDVTVINRGAVSLQMQGFKLLVDGEDVPLRGTSILHNSLSKAFETPLETKRAQVVTVKAHHLAKWLRTRGKEAKVRLTFTFIDVCHEEFSCDYMDFDPMAYEDSPDSVSFQEWD